MEHPNATAHAARLAALEGVDDDLRRLAAGEWMCIRASESLLRQYGETHFTCATINRIFYDAPDEAKRLLRELAPGVASDVAFLPPIMIDYGPCLVVGERTFINCDFLIIGGGPVVIGTDCLIGPRYGIYTPNHAEDPVERLDGRERTAPVVIGDNVWLGGSVSIMQGVTIGRDSIIGAGSVVTKDIPPGVIAVGNTCKPLRPIEGPNVKPPAPTSRSAVV